MRLDDAITYFLGGWPAEGPTRDTARTYAGQLKWLVGYAASRHKVLLSDLTPDFLRAAIQAKMATPQNRSLNYKGGESAAKSLACATRKLASWLLAQGVPVHDLRSVKIPRAPERVQLRLRDDEFRAIEDAILRRLVDVNRRVPRLATARDLALIYLLADTGLRSIEVCGMDVRSVDFATGAVLIVRGKFKKERALSIVDPGDRSGGITLRLLADWIDLRATIGGASSHQRLWTSTKGNPLSRESLRKIIAKICADAGLSESRPPHTFRRANFTTNYLAEPSSIRVLAARMGWSPKSQHMIDVYTRGADIDLARTTPLPSLAARWHESTITKSDQRPIPINAAGLRAGYVERPSPVSPTKETQGLGRLPSSRTSRRYKA